LHCKLTQTVHKGIAVTLKLLFKFLVKVFHIFRVVSCGTRGSFPGGQVAGAWIWPLTCI